MAEEVIYTVHCPRCDRAYSSSVSRQIALDICKEHVSLQHPDHDPNWAEDGR